MSFAPIFAFRSPALPEAKAPRTLEDAIKTIGQQNKWIREFATQHEQFMNVLNRAVGSGGQLTMTRINSPSDTTTYLEMASDGTIQKSIHGVVTPVG